MKGQGFLSRLKKEGKLKLVEPSEDIYESYARKSGDCLRSGKILLRNGLYENSISECYYAMYNALTALLYRCGIKCENHTGSIMLLGKAFGRRVLSEAIGEAKKERVDKQYYIASGNGDKMNREDAKRMVKAAEEFTLEIRLIADAIGEKDVEGIRKSVAGY